MKKIDKFKKDMLALSLISAEVLNFEMKFLLKDNILHTQYKRKDNDYIGPCRFGGDVTLTLTEPLNVFESSDNICVRCLEFISFDGTKDGILPDLMFDFMYLPLVYRNLNKAEKFSSLQPVIFFSIIGELEPHLNGIYANVIKSRFAPRISSLTSYEVVFLNLFNSEAVRLKNVKQAYENLVLSDSFEKKTLKKIVEFLHPLPIATGADFEGEVSLVKNERKNLLKDSGWSLFHVNFNSYRGAEQKAITLLLKKYETKHESLFYAPQLYLDYCLNLNLPAFSVPDSVRFDELLSDELLETVLGIYDTKNANVNSYLQSVLDTAKLL